MLQLLRYLWDDTFSFAATAGMLIGSLVACIPKMVPTLPPSYGFWVAGICAAFILYRGSKAAILLRLGKRTEARIVQHYRGFRGVSKLIYFFNHATIAVGGEPVHFNIHGKWQTSRQNEDGHDQLTIAYWERYPRIHIAYWSYNGVDRSKKSPS